MVYSTIYVDSTIRTSPKWSMRARGGHERINSFPGPGTYDSRDGYTIKREPQFTFHGVDRSGGLARKSDAPGPGQYNLRKDEYKPVVIPPKNVGGRFDGYDSFLTGAFLSSPGPGQYELRSTLGRECPKYTMGSKTKGLTAKDQAPGPARYDIKDKMVCRKAVRGCSQGMTSAWKFSSTPRDLVTKDNYATPGPGSYDYKHDTLGHKSSSTHWSFTGSRDQLGMGGHRRGNSTPGPGNYTVYTQFRA